MRVETVTCDFCKCDIESLDACFPCEIYFSGNCKRSVDLCNDCYESFNNKLDSELPICILDKNEIGYLKDCKPVRY